VTASPGRRLREALAAQSPLLLPGVHDALSARLAERAGFSAAYLSGSATAMSLLGVPDIGLLSGAEIIEQARRITAVSAVALVCDGDTGFGNAVNVAYTVQRMEAAGVAAIQLEDQTYPKRCGHFSGKSVVSAEEMLQKLHAAVEARSDQDFVIIARTDARAVHGLEEAIDRGRRYAAAGAEVIFVEAPRTVEELQAVSTRIDAPTLVNVVEGGRTPRLPLAAYGDLGFDVVLYPTAAVRTASHALGSLYGHLHAAGTTEGAPVEMISFPARNAVNDLPGWEAIGTRAADAVAPPAGPAEPARPGA
jgi:2-methylisocitrate lyase-like PEP mutase family enzyme